MLSIKSVTSPAQVNNPTKKTPQQQELDDKLLRHRFNEKHTRQNARHLKPLAQMRNVIAVKCNT